jgi:CHAD domain-containing protein
MSYVLKAGEPVDDGLRRCAAERLDRAARALEQGLVSEPEKAVHTARKSLKQTRSLLRLARAALPPRVRRAENRALAELGRALSGARDADVMVAAFDQLAAQRPAIPVRSRDVLRRALIAPAPSSDNGAAGAVSPELSAARVADALRAIESRVQDWPLTSDGWPALGPGLDHAYRRGRRALRTARSDPGLESLHEWRKRVKDHWYHLRLLSEVGGPALAGEAQDASKLADLLGEEHDLGVLEEKLHAGAAPTAAREQMLERIDARRRELRARAFALGERVYAEKPPAHRRRLRRAWRAGRALASIDAVPAGDRPAG